MESVVSASRALQNVRAAQIQKVMAKKLCVPFSLGTLYSRGQVVNSISVPFTIKQIQSFEARKEFCEKIAIIPCDKKLDVSALFSSIYADVDSLLNIYLQDSYVNLSPLGDNEAFAKELAETFYPAGTFSTVFGRTAYKYTRGQTEELKEEYRPLSDRVARLLLYQILDQQEIFKQELVRPNRFTIAFEPHFISSLTQIFTKMARNSGYSSLINQAEKLAISQRTYRICKKVTIQGPFFTVEEEFDFDFDQMNHFFEELSNFLTRNSAMISQAVDREAVRNMYNAYLYDLVFKYQLMGKILQWYLQPCPEALINMFFKEYGTALLYYLNNNVWYLKGHITATNFPWLIQKLIVRRMPIFIFLAFNWASHRPLFFIKMDNDPADPKAEGKITVSTPSYDLRITREGQEALSTTSKLLELGRSMVATDMNPVFEQMLKYLF